MRRYPPDMLLIHSLAGGSGSGLGSRVLESVREGYPRALIMVGMFALSGSDWPRGVTNRHSALVH